EQPVIFLGSEGERGVVAGNLSDFLWVLADGVGPLEVVQFGDTGPRPNAAPLTDLATRHATTPRRPAATIVTEAQAEFPDFSDHIDALCRCGHRRGPSLSSASRVIADPKEVQLLDIRYGTIRAQALSPRESTAFIERVLGET